MDAVAALGSLGGTARPMQLRRLVGRAAIAAAVSSGTIAREAGVYALLPAERPAMLATALRGVRSHRSAAAHWGLALPPDESTIHVTVMRKAQRRNVPTDVALHYRDHSPAERAAGVTCLLRTVLDCLRDEPLPIALAVGDSALRQRRVTRADLVTATRGLRGRGSRQLRDRIELLDPRAENAFESVCRALLLAAGVVGFEPQVAIRRGRRWIGRVDLAHRRLRVIIECDGFESHGARDSFRRDLVRHSELTAAGWRTLRFTWEQVMFRPEWVIQCVLDVLAEAA